MVLHSDSIARVHSSGKKPTPIKMDSSPVRRSPPATRDTHARTVPSSRGCNSSAGLQLSHFPANTGDAGRNDLHGNGLELLPLPFHKALAELEKRLIEYALRESGGNKTEAANRLQINRRLL
jgi:DNA-binding NtrC family response regulator